LLHEPAARIWERFDEDRPRDRQLAERIVEEALVSGAEEAEVYLKVSATLGVFLNDRFTTLTGGSEKGIALRVFDGQGGFGHAFSSWVEEKEKPELTRMALAALRSSSGAGSRAEPASPTPRPLTPFPEPEGLVDPGVREWELDEKREMLEAALGEASWGRPGDAAATYRDGISRVTLVNSRGLDAATERTLAMVTLSRAGGNSPTFHAEWVAGGPDRDAVLEMAASLARLQVGGSEEAVDLEELILEPPAAVSLLRRLAQGLVESPSGSREPDQGATIQRAASDAVTVVDDGLLPHGVATSPFDGEGVPTGRLTLVKAGVRIERVRRSLPGEQERPGNAVRVSYRDLPFPGGTNLFIVPGHRTLGEILSGVSRGFLLGILESDARQGESDAFDSWWRGVGWEVRRGGIVGPCRRILFHARAHDLLEGILEVADQLRFVLRRGVAFGSPGLLIRSRR